METLKDTLNGNKATHRSGFVALIGRPNVGKSTLLNQLLGQKVAIVTPKPQTTRQRIIGIKTLPDAQIIFIDTPGLHLPRSLINRRMVQVAERASDEADVLLWVVDATEGLTAGDRKIAERLHDERRPVCLVVNKIDQRSSADLLPILASIAELLPDRDVVPVSAQQATNCDKLLSVIVGLLPEGPCFYDADTVTDQTERMLAQEAVREQVLLQTRQEVPYGVAVTIDQFEEKNNLAVISATIHVEKASQKGILIGHRGSRIKEIGQAARVELERLLDRRVYLELFVRVQADWTTRESLLKEFGL